MSLKRSKRYNYPKVVCKFVLEEYWSDILVTDKNINEINKRLSDMSQICGYEIKITLEFHVEFTDRIIYPEQFYGDHYYRPKYNKILHSILKIIGISIPLEPMQHSRFFQNNNAGPDISL